MVYGKPVINTDLPSGVPYVSLNGKTGITVKPGDADELKEAIQSLVDDPSARKSYGTSARERVMSEFNEDDVIVKLHNLLSNI